MKVRFRARALDDIASIFQFRSIRHSREVAARVEAAIFATTKLLGRHPELGTRTDHKAEVRRWPMTDYDYTVFYLIDKGSLDVLRVLDGKLMQNLNWVRGLETR
jgi:plasmid stabilization system protein ParE